MKKSDKYELMVHMWIVGAMVCPRTWGIVVCIVLAFVFQWASSVCDKYEALIEK